MYCQSCKPLKHLAMAIHIVRRIFSSRGCWAGLRMWTIPVKPHFWLCPPDKPCAVCWGLLLQILPLCSCTTPIGSTVDSCQRKPGQKEEVPMLPLPVWCSVSSHALAQVLTSSQGERDWDLNPVKTNFFFSFPFGLILNHAYTFIQFTKYLHKCCCQHREGHSSAEGMSDCELHRIKERQTFISVAAAACALLKLLWKYSRVTTCHRRVWMDNLHHAPLYLSCNRF